MCKRIARPLAPLLARLVAAAVAVGTVRLVGAVSRLRAVGRVGERRASGGLVPLPGGGDVALVRRAVDAVAREDGEA